MPSGLDGNPDPITSAARDRVLSAVADRVLDAARSLERTAVAIDGRSGAGKSTFADELAARLGAAGVTTIRSTTDSFHRPREDRLRSGATSPAGYYTESHQLDAIVSELLEPFTGGASSVRTAAFDEPTDRSVDERATISGPTVLIFDGLFLQRPELAQFWDVVVYLTADRRLDAGWLDFLLADLPDDPSARATLIDDRLARARWPRYRQGWSMYLDALAPAESADIVVDNNDLGSPSIVGGGRRPVANP